MNSSPSISSRLNSGIQLILEKDGSLPFYAFSFWFAFNLSSFSGLPWATESGHESFERYLFTLTHLIACIAMLTFMAAQSKAAATILLNRKAVSALCLLGSLGCAGITVMSSLNGGSFITYCAIGFSSILTGFGTTAIFLRSGMMFGKLIPSRTLGIMAKTCFFGCFLMVVIQSSSLLLAQILFILLPCGGGFALLLAPNDGHEAPKQTAEPSTFSRVVRKQFAALACMLGMYAFIAELAKNIVGFSLPVDIMLRANLHSALILAALFVILYIVSLLGVDDMRNRISSIYSSLVVVILVLFVFTMLVNTKTPGMAALAESASLLLFFVGWNALAYLAFQTGRNPIVVFGFGNAALSFGTLLGLLTATLPVEPPLQEDLSLFLCIGVLSIAFVCSFIIFPQHKLMGILLPLASIVQEESPAKSKVDKETVAVIQHGIAKDYGLSKREEEVLALLAQNESPEAIAKKLFISVSTTRTHIRNIYSKLQVHSRQDLSAFLEREINKRST